MPEPVAPPPLASGRHRQVRGIRARVQGGRTRRRAVPGRPPGDRRFSDAAGPGRAASSATTRPFTLQVGPTSLLLGGAAPPAPDRRSRNSPKSVSADDRRVDGQSRRPTPSPGGRCCCCSPGRLRKFAATAASRGLWATAGGPSLDIVEIDYAEVLREKQGDAATIDQIIEAAIAGPQVQLDDTTLQSLLAIVGHPEKFEQLLKQLEAPTRCRAASTPKTAAFLNLVRNLTEHLAKAESGAARRHVEADGRGGRGLLARRHRRTARAARSSASHRRDDRCGRRRWPSG